MSFAIESEAVKIVLIFAADGREIGLVVSPEQAVGDLLRAAGAGFGLSLADAGAMRLRREGDVLPLCDEQIVADVLRAGDRLNVERAVMGGRMSASAGEAEAFDAAAGLVAARVLSPDSGTFLESVRQVTGE